MRILLLSNPDATHTYKWARGLASCGNQLVLLGMQQPSIQNYQGIPNLELHSAGVPSWITALGEGSFGKVCYLQAIGKIRQLVKRFQPDVIHAHYVSSYGLVAALAGKHPLVISVWGSDIYEFPDHSSLKRKLVQYALNKADRVTSTSDVMAQRTRAVWGNTQKPIAVVPFGVDTTFFAPQNVQRPFNTSDIVIGTVKTLADKYGIRYLIEAFALLRRRHPELPLKLLIVGDGPQGPEYKQLVERWGLAEHTLFTGFVTSDQVPRYHNMLDVYVAVSTVDSESFGVAVIEAGSCAKPVVVSNVGGLPEVVADKQTGFIVEKCNAQATADAIETLILNPSLREQMGLAGRKHVEAHYQFQVNLEQMMKVYEQVASR